MSPRAYRLGKRKADVDETRERVVAAATELFGQPGFYTVTLDDVATRAGVARATVYYQFESKYGLLDAVIASFAQRAGLERMRKAREHGDAAVGLPLYVKETARFWSKDVALMRNIHGLSAVDTEVFAIIERWDLQRKELLSWFVKRLADQRKLRAGVSQKQAVDVLWMLTGFRAFDQLHARAKMSVRAAGDALSDLAVRALLEPAG
jgi:AcrR family transcriptional regulator